jgi:hypothetical protein
MTSEDSLPDCRDLIKAYPFQRELGKQRVLVKKIIGSRAAQYFHSDWTPVKKDGRWLRVYESMKEKGFDREERGNRSKSTRIELWKFGNKYFVGGNGNRRVSVAHILGISHVEACVIEFSKSNSKDL